MCARWVPAIPYSASPDEYDLQGRKADSSCRRTREPDKTKCLGSTDRRERMNEMTGDYKKQWIYIEELPKFTKKHTAGAYQRISWTTWKIQAENCKSHPCGRDQWKRFCVCLSAGCLTGRRKDSRVFHIATSGKDQ